MGLKECLIKLDNPWNTYYPGQTINGVAEFTFTAPKKVRGISVKIKGACSTKWSEMMEKTIDGKTTSVQVDHTGEEEYFSITYYILGSKTGNEIEIAGGTHSYPFTCALPPTLPSSFEGEFGHVRYTVKITLDRPWKFDQDTKMAFTVVSHMDLNLNPDYRLPIQIHHQKTFCCFCCASGPLNIDANIPAAGFCPGQWIPVELSIENGSSVKLNEIILKLIKSVIYRSTMPSNDIRTDEVVLFETKLGKMMKNSSKNWQEFIQVPPLPPSNLTNCSLIDLDYKFAIEVQATGCHTSVSEERCIIIGTVPLVGFDPQPPSGNGDPSPAPAPATDIPDAPLMQPGGQPVANNVLYPALSAYPNMAQPVFQQGQFATASIHDAGDHAQMVVNQPTFAPCYPTYGFVARPMQ